MEEATVKPKNVGKTFELEFSRLPALAGFIRANYLKDYIKEQLKYCAELDVPIMKFFSSLTEEQEGKKFKPLGWKNEKLALKNIAKAST